MGIAEYFTAKSSYGHDHNMNFTNNKLLLAPLAGITDSVFRGICKGHGADIVMSEMVSAEGLFYKSKMTESLLFFKEHERPIGIQLFGSNPDHLAFAADVVQKKFNPDFIDLNSGCPAPKIAGKNGGSCLLKDINLFSTILSTMVKAISIPLTVKIRSGWFEHEWVDVEFSQAAQTAGVSAITVHPRSKTMGFSGHSYWERIAIVKKAVSIPVIGNGDILTPDDALRMFSETGCDSVMIGRGALGNPWLFSQIKQAMDKNPVHLPTAQEKIDTAISHVHIFLERNGERQTVCDCKKHASWYLKGLNGSSALRSRIFTANSTQEIFEALETAKRLNT
jgi:tRNA-dihydrouridine synthase B